MNRIISSTYIQLNDVGTGVQHRGVNDGVNDLVKCRAQSLVIQIELQYPLPLRLKGGISIMSEYPTQRRSIVPAWRTDSWGGTWVLVDNLGHCD